MRTDNRKIAVAVSGGVDSSVAAHVLKEQGCDVHGVFIAIRNPAHIPCTHEQDRQDAMRACAALRIPFAEYDATETYRKQVIEPFVEAYRRGETPNPDILCNTYIKFGVLWEYLKDRGYDTVATGHYARVRERNSRVQLCRANDEEKDQTYFIHAIAQEALDAALFPIGERTKTQVRAMARKANLPAADKKDSTGLCFLGDVSMQDFLSAYIEPKKGEVVLAGSGENIGEHDGAAFYTLGQRHGFTVTAKERGPYIVTGKDVHANTLFVARKDAEAQGTTVFTIVDTVFRERPDGAFLARHRHRGALYPVSARAEKGDEATVTYETLVTVAPGQSIVLYTEDGVCIGGGAVR